MWQEIALQQASWEGIFSSQNQIQINLDCIPGGERGSVVIPNQCQGKKNVVTNLPPINPPMNKTKLIFANKCGEPSTQSVCRQFRNTIGLKFVILSAF